MKNQTIMNRKSAKKLLMVQWSRFQNVCIELEGSTLVTGVNGSGKSTVLDAMTYLLTGNTQFNKAAKDRDRTVLGYVRGDTRSNGEARYLRNGSVVSYIAMEFSDPTLGVPLTVGVCIESPSESGKPVSSWFICPGAAIDDIDFTRIEGNALRITPKNELTVNGEAMKLSSFMGRDRGTEAVLRALGLRVDAVKYRTKLLKMMAFNPENNIDQFIQDCVLEPGKVQSLEELREQKRQFERLRELYESLRQGKIQLEEVLRQSDEYEKKKRVLRIRELMLSYQALREKEEEEKQTKNRYQALKDQYGRLTERAGELARQQEAAQERLRIAENNDMVKGMQESLDSLKRQIEEADREKKNWEDKLAQILKLKKKISALIKLLEADLPSLSSENTYLETLEQADGETAKKREAFDAFREKVHRQDGIYEENKIHLQDQCKEREKEIGALQEKICRLESNILVFPAEVENARNKIQRGLEKQGIQTEVHIFAELVQEVTAPEWRKAVETFLGRKRFYIIVDGAHCHKAMQILQKERIYDGNVVITDKLPETEAVEGSAAEILRIPNVYARRYANYLLNGIHLCENLEELHEYPKGGLMRDGMLAKSYAVAMMDMRRTELCLGADAIRCQLEQSRKELEELQVVQQADKEMLSQVIKCRDAIKEIDWDGGHYDFGAAYGLKDCKKRRDSLVKDREEIEANPDFTAVLKELETAGRLAREANESVNQNQSELGGCKNDLKTCEGTLGRISTEIYLCQKAYEEKCLVNMELKEAMLEEYNRESEKRGTIRVTTQLSIDKSKNMLAERERQLEDAQLAYCRLAGIDVGKRGIGYIPWYREEYRNLAHVKVEEAQQKLQEQAGRLESAFMNDFVAEIDENVREAKREMDAINRELRHMPFGNDTYKFVMKEKPDRALFFRICRRLEKYMSSPQVYMNSARDDEEMENDIQEFMSIILAEEDEWEYTDYRRYFSYDMEISSRQGQTEITAELSKKQGSASNGEKQTPYFIILAASLLQCYPANTCCARLAFIDEAFSALSRERIEQMVHYFEENHFQVFYAAPPEKINSIGQFIDSTVSLIVTGRYTNAVEGLVKQA